MSRVAGCATSALAIAWKFGPADRQSRSVGRSNSARRVELLSIHSVLGSKSSRMTRSFVTIVLVIAVLGHVGSRCGE